MRPTTLLALIYRWGDTGWDSLDANVELSRCLLCRSLTVPSVRLPLERRKSCLSWWSLSLRSIWKMVFTFFFFLTGDIKKKINNKCDHRFSLATLDQWSASSSQCSCSVSDLKSAFTSCQPGQQCVVWHEVEVEFPQNQVRGRFCVL